MAAVDRQAATAQVATVSTAESSVPPQAPLAGLPESVRAALAAAHLPESALAVVVLDGTGRARLRSHAEEPREVGSLIKLVTTLVALDRLGPGFRFHTDLLADPLPRPSDGWQLSLRGGGDPGLRGAELVGLLREAEAQGVQRLGAPVWLDDSRFAASDAATTGITDQPGSPSLAAPSALMVDLAAVAVWLPPGRQGRPLVTPDLPLSTAGLARPDAVQPVCPDDWLEALRLEPAPAPPRAAHQLILGGTWPPNCPAATIWRSPLPAPEHFAWSLESAWRGLGHPEPLRFLAHSAPSYARVALRLESRPLSELIRDTNKFSNNVMARALLLDLAAEAGALPATVADGDRQVRLWLASHQLEFPELEFDNGSGLSHRERLSADHLAALLRVGGQSTFGPEFLASLPIAGVDGTLQSRFRSLEGSARLRLKTGTVDGARALAGYLLDRTGGAPSVVVALINGPAVDRAGTVQTALLQWLLDGESATTRSDRAPDAR